MKNNILPFKKPDFSEGNGQEPLTWEQLFFTAMKEHVGLSCVQIDSDPESNGKREFHFIPYAQVETDIDLRFYAFDKESEKFYLEICIQFTGIDGIDEGLINTATDDLLNSYAGFGEARWVDVLSGSL